jgi:hypothetical protein
MLSIIICSRNKDISKELKENIQATIGVDYELIVIDNSKNKYSIFSAYNEGERRAKYSYLCFMHEDILYHTIDWGKKVLEHFKNPKIGIIGIAGGHYLPHTPASWLSTSLYSINILQSSSKDGVKTTKHIQCLNYLDGISIEVIAIDGVWFCIPKSLFPTISFDEKNFKGFHFYDVDICLQARQAGYKVLMVSDILLEHFSIGSFTNEWISNATVCYNKWEKYLPQISDIKLKPNNEKTIEYLVNDKFDLLIEINRLVNSKAYRIGKILLKPFSIIKRMLYKH